MVIVSNAYGSGSSQFRVTEYPFAYPLRFPGAGTKIGAKGVAQASGDKSDEIPSPFTSVTV